MTQRVFIIDTNVVISGLLSSTSDNSVTRTPTAKILDAMLNGSLLYVLSAALLEEYQKVLLRPKIVKLHGLIESEVKQLLTEIVANSIWRETPMSHQAPDQGDNHIWSLLLQSADTTLVTGDQLLLNKPPPDRSIVTPATFTELFYNE